MAFIAVFSDKALMGGEGSGLENPLTAREYDHVP